MAALILDPFPEGLHARLSMAAREHQRSVMDETIALLEDALAAQSENAPPLSGNGSYWQNGPLLPAYEAALKAGQLSAGRDSAALISEEREQG